MQSERDQYPVPVWQGALAGSLRVQGNFLLLGLVLLLSVTCTVNGSVRPASVSEVREVLVLGPERNVHKEIEDGILLPPLPSQAKVKEEGWGRSMNFVQPIIKPFPEVRLFQAALYRLKPDFDAKLENNGADTGPMPYVDSSQFRTSSSKAESTSVGTVPGTKNPARKTTVLVVAKTQNKGSKVEKVAESRKKVDLSHEDSLRNSAVEMPKAAPPVWSHALLADELSDPFSQLPSHEEYDRNSRYTHSILYGFNTEF